MAICDVLDLRCIFVNEIVGSVLLTAVFSVIIYFIIAAKLRLGFDTTIAFLLPIILIFGLMLTGFSTIYYVITIFVGILVAWVFNEIIRNR